MNLPSQKILYRSTIFTGAFLLFMIQPLVGKQLLPVFGGSASVWMVCLMFFQIVLFLGYAYAHTLRRLFSPRIQSLVHCALGLVSLTWLMFGPRQFPENQITDPEFSLTIYLAIRFGLPLVLIAATSPLVQNWYTKVFDTPYRLYALSNLGSLVALLSYPVVVEPLTNLTFQADAWMMGFLVYVVFCFILSYFLYGHVTTETIGSDSSTTNRDKANWFVLSMVGVLVLLSSTNELTREIAPVPLLWTLPLAIYLLTFIICFDRPHWYRPIFFHPLFGFSLASILYLYTTDDYQHLDLNIGVYSFFIFSACMICHGELERRKPHFDDLTEYYLLIALGGVVGALLINLLAPSIFNDYIEFEGIVLLTILVSGFFLTAKSQVKRILVRITSLATISLCGYVFYEYRDTTATIYESRNFYGALRVIDLQPDTPGHHRKLLNDDINHGSQFQSDEYQQLPTTYFSYKSGVGIVLLTHRPPHRSVGIIGLGPGTLAAYGRTGDRFRFYELNPEVLEVAQTYFSYLSRSPAQIEVVIGDARVALQKDLAGDVRFDILVIDAFSGDSIPTHLLTEEAWQLYWKILAPDGVLAVHLSNKYVDLIPVVRYHNMNMPGYVLRGVNSKEDESWDIQNASWLIHTANNDFLDAVESHTQSLDSPKAPVRWRDDRSSVINLFN